MNAGPDPHVIIRAAHVTDIPALLRMMEELASHHGDVSGITAEILERDAFGPDPWVTILVADRPGIVLGYVTLCRLYRQKDGRKGMLLEHLFVDSRARGKGIGRRLVEATLAEARRLGCTFCSVEAHPDNVKAQGFYKTFGFEQSASAGQKFRLTIGTSAC